MRIEYWSDYACPYCYIGETHLKTAMDHLGIDDAEVTMNAFELDPHASAEYEGPTVDRFATKYGLSKAQAAARIESISNMGREAGLEFEYAQTRYTNTFDAHRLTKLVRERRGDEAANALSEALYDAYFAKGLELADREVLVGLAEKAGLDAAEASDLLDGDAYAVEVRADERVASAMGIHAVPYFVIDGKYAVPGAMPTEEFEKVLLKVSAEEDAAVAEGASCGPDGCTF